MSMYGVVLNQLRGDAAGKTATQLATTLHVPVKAVQDALDELVLHKRVINTAGVYTEPNTRRDS
jgi:hypothetical protein